MSLNKNSITEEMVPHLHYIETAKMCPKCNKMTLFFTIMLYEVDKRNYGYRLGVKCNDPECGYKKEVYQQGK